MRARCPKCGRYVPLGDVHPVLDVLTVPGTDILHDVYDCPRDGRVEVSWW